MTDTYSIYYETPNNTTIVGDLTLLDVVTHLLYLQEHQVLTHDDYLEIRDNTGTTITSAIDYIDSLVEFEVLNQGVPEEADLVDAIYAVDALEYTKNTDHPVIIAYRLRGTQEWTTYND